MRRSRRLRGVANWLNLSTPAGLVLARWAADAAARGPDDLWIAHGYRPAVPPAPAFTLGSVILLRAGTARAADPMAGMPPRLLAHEDRHATQYALCGGVLMPLAYVAASGWSWLRTGDRASRNPFERDAGLVTGGYRERPVRPVADAGAHLCRNTRAALRRMRGTFQLRP
jgi:hypothetical protein